MDAVQREIQRLRDELERKDRGLKSANDAKVYCLIKATEANKQVQEMKNHFIDQELKHKQEYTDVLAENIRLQKEVKATEAARVVDQQMLREAEEKARKTQIWLDQERADSKLMSMRIKAAEGDEPLATPDAPLKSRLRSETSKRKADEGEASLKDEVTAPSKKPKLATDSFKDTPQTHKNPKASQVACTQCFVHGWDCDHGAPCSNCVTRGKPGGCKRVMCKYYEKDTCSNQKCHLAHEGDGYLKVVPFSRLSRDDKPSESPVEKAGRQMAEAEKQKREKKEAKRSKKRYDGLAKEWAKKKREGKDDGEGDDMARV